MSGPRLGAILLGLLTCSLTQAGGQGNATAPPSPAVADPDWHIPAEAATAPENPAYPEYRALAAALVRYEEIEAAGGWPGTPGGPDLRIGMRDDRVDTLRRRLRITGDFSADVQADASFFDTAMDAAVRRFQARHGLRASGVMDGRTREAANVPVADRIAQLRATLTRWRWLPAALPDRYVWVNIPAASLDVVAGGEVVLSMRTIVGNPDRPTPAFRSAIRQIIFNPSWSVPRTIAVEDLLPEQQQDPGFLTRANIRVMTADGSGFVDAAKVPWARLNADHFPYRLVQSPGPWNSLGRLKFDLDDPFDIYLHDTPGRGLFGLNRRTLSSGCIRLEDPVSLAALLISAQGAPPGEAEARLARRETQAIRLQPALPVFVVYLTVWTERDGSLHFGPDVYGRDARLLRALEAGAGA